MLKQMEAALAGLAQYLFLFMVSVLRTPIYLHIVVYEVVRDVCIDRLKLVTIYVLHKLNETSCRCVHLKSNMADTDQQASMCAVHV
jgi:hypothetical protein